MCNPTPYVIDLGVDANLGIESGSAYPLQQGLVQVSKPQSGEGSPQFFNRFREADTLAFRVWDITSPFASVGGDSASQQGVLAIRHFEAAFLDPPDPASSLKSPFATEVLNPIDHSSEIFPIQDPAIKTSVFLGHPNGWLIGSPNSPLGQTFELINRGSYLLSVTIDVVLMSQTLRTYRVDPEVIVGSSELPDPGLED